MDQHHSMPGQPREELRNRFPWQALLSLIVIIAAGCTGGGVEGVETATQESERTITLTTTAIPTTTTIHTSTATPAATAALTSTATATPTATTAPTATSRPTAPTGPLSGEQLVSALRNGGYVIYFRHAATDPVPDDANPVIFSDCSTQRNLSTAGREQAGAIGQSIERLKIPVGQVLSSPFCRALDTAQLAFGEASIEPVLENLETAENEAERVARIEGLRRLLSDPPEGATNRVLVGHGFNIAAAAEVTIAEGEAAIFYPPGEGGFTLVATVLPAEWEELVARLAYGQPGRDGEHRDGEHSP